MDEGAGIAWCGLRRSPMKGRLIRFGDGRDAPDCFEFVYGRTTTMKAASIDDQVTIDERGRPADDAGNDDGHLVDSAEKSRNAQCK